MRLNTRLVEVLSYRIAVAVWVCIAAGCGSKSAKLPTYMSPELLYLNHQPYSRIYVEVDSIEGVDVPAQWLDELKTFLSEHCSKPDGIEIVRDPPLPISEVEGMPIGAASILCLDGPDPDSGSQPAYLHVFFYDKNVGLKTERRGPHVSRFCPCSILFDVSKFWISKGKVEEFALKHELGHVLGLCKDPEHSDGAHCQKSECLMYKGPGLLNTLGLLLGSRVEKQLCADCQRDLEALKSMNVDPRLSFKGPFLIRREEGYVVASLPYFDVIIPPDVESIDWTEFLSLTRDRMRERGWAALNEDRRSSRRGWYFKGHWHGPPRKDALSENVTVDPAALLSKAVDDPCPLVKRYATDTLKKLEQEQQR